MQPAFWKRALCFSYVFGCVRHAFLCFVFGPPPGRCPAPFRRLFDCRDAYSFRAETPSIFDRCSAPHTAVVRKKSRMLQHRCEQQQQYTSNETSTLNSARRKSSMCAWMAVIQCFISDNCRSYTSHVPFAASKPVAQLARVADTRHQTADSGTTLPGHSRDM